MENKHKLKHRFDIVRKLGQGTYGKVQLAINKETGQEVAIKTIKKSKIENEQDAVRIRREIQIMSSIRHPNIVHIYEVFENKDKIVLVMQNASGGELYEYLSERKVLNDLEARRIFRQVVAAVYYIHKNKICHRDLKLENILLDEKGNAKIADFGLSNVYDQKNLLNTFCGSPLYASPEIVKGLPYYGPEVDCWSLGVLLYTLVYGAMPFDGSNFKKLVKQISNGDYYEPKQKAPASGLIRQLLTVNALDRANIVDVCKDSWVNDGYDTQLLQVAEDLANLSPVRVDLLIALQPQATKEEGSESETMAKQNSNSKMNEDKMNTTVDEIAPLEDDAVVPSSSLMRMTSRTALKGSSTSSVPVTSCSMKSISNVSGVLRNSFENEMDDALSTVSTHSFQALAREMELQDQDLLQKLPVTKAASTYSINSEERCPHKSVSRASIELKIRAGKERTPEVFTTDTSSDGNENIRLNAEETQEQTRSNDIKIDVSAEPLHESVQNVQIITRKSEQPSSIINAKESPDIVPASLVWPAVAAVSKSTDSKLSPENSFDSQQSIGSITSDTSEMSLPRGLPMKSYKKFTFERNGGQVVVREKICQKEEKEGNRKIVVEKKVTSSRTSSFDKNSLSDGMESMKIRKGDDSSDEDDFDLHFDSSHGPMGILNVMKFMDKDFRLRWQNHPIFQNVSRRSVLPPSSDLLHRRMHSPSLMKMFMDHRDLGATDDLRKDFSDMIPSHHPLLAHDSVPLSLHPSVDSRSSFRKLNRGSSLDRSSMRDTRPQQSVRQNDTTGSKLEEFKLGFRPIPRYSRTVSDKAISEAPLPTSPNIQVRTHVRSPVVHMELAFSGKNPPSIGLKHSFSNNGLWQHQQSTYSSPSSSAGVPTRVEMKVHYSMPSPASSSHAASHSGIPPRPPKTINQERRAAEEEEESVSDRINRRSYYHRFSSVERQLPTRPTSTIWDQQLVSGAGAGALWEAASPDKPLGARLKSQAASETNPSSM